MNHLEHISPAARDESLRLRQTNAAVKTLLANAAVKLRTVLRDDVVMEEIPVEVDSAMDSALEDILAAIRALNSVAPERRRTAVQVPGGPTR